MKNLLIFLNIISMVSCQSNNNNPTSQQILNEMIEGKLIATLDTIVPTGEKTKESLEILIDSMLMVNVENQYEYISLRDSLIKILNSNSVIEKTFKSDSKFAVQDLDEIHSRYLDELEKALLIITKDNPLNGSFIDPESSLESLIKMELGFDKIDAIVTRRDSFDLYVTTNILFRNYYGMETEIDYNLGALCNIFQGTQSGAVILGMYSYKVSIIGNNSPIYIAIVIESQDPYPTQPKRFYALWTIDEFIYILQPRYPEYLSFHECHGVLDSLLNSSKFESDIYQIYFSECCLEDSIGKNQLVLSESIVREIIEDIESEKSK